MRRVLIVEDDEDVRDILKRYLEVDAFEVETAGSIVEMWQKLSSGDYDVMILDLMLPDGLAVNEIAEIRTRKGNMGILILSARDTDTDVILGIELGADDYVTKPFNPREVVARVKAIIRRTKGSGKKLVIGDLEMDLSNFSVKLKGEKIDLSTTEFKILSLLAGDPERVFTRNEILDRVWGEDSFISDRVVDVHISSLRSKIGKDRIKTVRGVGYKFQVGGDRSDTR